MKLYKILIFGILFIILIGFVLAAPSLYEYYNTGQDGQNQMRDAIGSAQTFTVGNVGANENFNITSIKARLYRIGSPGTLYVEIRTVNGSGDPTQTILTTGSMNGNSLTTNTAGAWYEINVTSYGLEASTGYTIRMHCPEGTVGNVGYHRIDTTSSTYGGGHMYYTDDNGTTFTRYTDFDTMFEVWGEVAVIDTCTYVGSGNWAVDCADNCTISENVVGDGSNLTIIGTGYFLLNSNISNFIRYFIQGVCQVTCKDGCFKG